MAPVQVRHEKLKIFISYSRQDRAVADAVVSALEGEGFEVTIDRRDLPYGEEWQKELADFIRASDTVIWLISPNSVASKWCNWELGELGRLHKRLVPIKICDMEPSGIPEVLGKIHVLPAEGVFSLSAHLTVLVDTLNADRSWIKEATRLADRAHQWTDQNRDSGLVLRGAALKDAEAWTSRQPRGVPKPSSEVFDLILASQRAATRRQRWIVVGSLAVAVTAGGLALWALINRSAAIAGQAAATAGQFVTEAQSNLSQRNFARAEIAAAKALTVRDTTETRNVLLTARSSGVRFVASSAEKAPPSELTVFSADARLTASVLPRGVEGRIAVAVSSTSDYKELWRIVLPLYAGPPDSIAFSKPTGDLRQLAIGWPEDRLPNPTVFRVGIWTLESRK